MSEFWITYNKNVVKSVIFTVRKGDNPSKLDEWLNINYYEQKIKSHSYRTNNKKNIHLNLQVSSHAYKEGKNK